MVQVVEGIVKEGKIIPLEDIRLEDNKRVIIIIEEKKDIMKYFGILKGKNVDEIIKEIENEGVL